MISIVDQVYIFLYAILGGAIVAFLYDILRIKRRAIKTSIILVSLEDILYWLVAAVLLFLIVYKSNSGEMRGYIFIGNVIF
jgi:spore cortex biosynthesis protein YabQ